MLFENNVLEEKHHYDQTYCSYRRLHLSRCLSYRYVLEWRTDRSIPERKYLVYLASNNRVFLRSFLRPIVLNNTSSTAM